MAPGSRHGLYAYTDIDCAVGLKTNFLWLVGCLGRYGGSGDDDQCSALALDAAGTSLFVLGTFSSSSMVITTVSGSRTLSNANSGTQDIFLLKLTASTGAADSPLQTLEANQTRNVRRPLQPCFSL